MKRLFGVLICALALKLTLQAQLIQPSPKRNLLENQQKNQFVTEVKYRSFPAFLAVNDTLEINIAIDNLVQSVLQKNMERLDAAFQTGNIQNGRTQRPREMMNARLPNLRERIGKTPEQPRFDAIRQNFIKRDSLAELALNLKVTSDDSSRVNLKLKRSGNFWVITEAEGLESAIGLYNTRKEQFETSNRKQNENPTSTDSNKAVDISLSENTVLAVSSATPGAYNSTTIMYPQQMDAETGFWNYDRQKSVNAFQNALIGMNTDADGIIVVSGGASYSGMCITDLTSQRLIYWIMRSQGSNTSYKIDVYDGVSDLSTFNPSRISILNWTAIYVLNRSQIVKLQFDPIDQKLKNPTVVNYSDFPTYSGNAMNDIAVGYPGGFYNYVWIVDIWGQIWRYLEQGGVYEFPQHITHISVNGVIMPTNAMRIEMKGNRIGFIRQGNQFCTFDFNYDINGNTATATLTDFGNTYLTSIGVDRYDDFMVSDGNRLHKLDKFGNYLASYNGATSGQLPFVGLNALSNAKASYSYTTALDIGTTELWDDQHGIRRFLPGADIQPNANNAMNVRVGGGLATLDWIPTNRCYYDMKIQGWNGSSWRNLVIDYTTEPGVPHPIPIYTVKGGACDAGRRLDQFDMEYLTELASTNGCSQLRFLVSVSPFGGGGSGNTRTSDAFSITRFIPASITASQTLTGDWVANQNVTVFNNATLTITNGSVRVSNGSARFSVIGNASIRITPSSRVFVGGGSTAAPFEVLATMPDTSSAGEPITTGENAVNADSLKRKRHADSLALLLKREPPKEYGLAQNYPNPFNPTTTIRYQLPVAGDVVLKIYDVLGHQVQTLVETRQAAGYYEVGFNAAQLASGVYFYRLSVRSSSSQAGGFVSTKKMMLIK